MNKTELITAMTERTGLTKKDCEAALAAVLDTIRDTLAEDGKVQIMGFGSFEVKERAAHEGRNPKTLETITIPASKAPVFKAGKALKDAVNK